MEPGSLPIARKLDLAPFQGMDARLPAHAFSLACTTSPRSRGEATG